MKQLILSGLASFFIGSIACGQNSQKNAQVTIPEDWKTLNESGFTIQYPDSFNLDISGQMGTSFILLSRQTSQHDMFQENINLIIQDMAGQNIDLDTYVEISEEQIKNILSDGNIIESIRIRTRNYEFQKIVYTGVHGQFNLKFEQHYRIEKDKAYILTLTCERSQYDNYKEVGEKIMHSFVIK